MSAVDLAPLDRAFQGVIPSVLATCSKAGVPNVIGLSHVYRVDNVHVALSEQFMRRSRENLEQTGRGEVLVVDGLTGEQYRLTLAFVRRDTDGPVFARIRAKLDGIAAETGMSHVFAVRAALVCRVDAVERVPVRGAPGAEPTAHTTGLAHVGALADRLQTAEDLEALVGVLLDDLVADFGFRHVALLVADEAGDRLFTCDSRGFAASGVGSEVRLGEGLLGQCVRARQPVRISSMTRELRYARSAGHASPLEIALPSLPDAESVLAVPLTTRARLVGLLVAESSQELAFAHEDELALSLVARLAAPEIARARTWIVEHPPTAAPATSPDEAAPGPALAVRYFEENDSVFVDGAYLVKGVAGRILWTLLRDHEDDGRSSFTNRELRLDPRLGLSAYHDNLEARLLLLRRRLAEGGVPLDLPATGRGRFRLACARPVTLEKVPTGRA